MIDVRCSSLGGQVLQICFADSPDGNRLSRREVFSRWKSDPTFSNLFAKALADCPFDAYCWETPPITKATLDLAFECVLVSSAALARQRSDRAPFAAHLGGANSVVAFENLGGDAELIVPTGVAPGANYAHLAAFLRSAPAGEISELWKLAGDQVENRLEKVSPLWVSTAGLGVAWLHLRLDSRPKYYSHAPYRVL
jgi:hypothetical protein